MLALTGDYNRAVSNSAGATDALISFLRGDLQRARSRLQLVEWVWAMLMLSGVLISIATLSSVVDRALQNYPSEVSGLLFGLVAASAIVTFSMVQVRGPVILATTLGVAGGASALLGYTATEDLSVSVPVFFAVGFLGIVAMLLPGLSGSSFLIMVGLYQPVLDSVNERRFGALGAFVSGAVLGVTTCSLFMRWALARHHDACYAAFAGLMLGSCRVLWPWPASPRSRTEVPAVDSRLSLPDSFSEDFLWPASLAVAGVAIVLALADFGMLSARRHEG